MREPCYKGGSAVTQWQSALLETEGPRFRASPASLSCVLEQDLVLVQPRKTHPNNIEHI